MSSQNSVGVIEDASTAGHPSNPPPGPTALTSTSRTGVVRGTVCTAKQTVATTKSDRRTFLESTARTNCLRIDERDCGTAALRGIVGLAHYTYI
jgi:hypothetical protein